MGTAARRDRGGRLLGLWRWLKPIRLGVNMLCCSVFFCWAGVLPRETISGLFGRKYSTVDVSLKQFWATGMYLIDWIHPAEPWHCMDTFRAEKDAREALGY